MYLQRIIRTIFSMFELIITTQIVRVYLEGPSIHKSPGADGFRLPLLKSLALNIADLLASLHIKTLEMGKVPVDWKTRKAVNTTE